MGVGESWAGPAECWGEDADVPACGNGWPDGDAVVGDFGAPPKADMNERTMQGISGEEERETAPMIDHTS